MKTNLTWFQKAREHGEYIINSQFKLTFYKPDEFWIKDNQTHHSHPIQPTIQELENVIIN